MVAGEKSRVCVSFGGEGRVRVYSMIYTRSLSQPPRRCFSAESDTPVPPSLDHMDTLMRSMFDFSRSLFKEEPFTPDRGASRDRQRPLVRRWKRSSPSANSAVLFRPPNGASLRACYRPRPCTCPDSHHLPWGVSMRARTLKWT